MSPRPAAGAQGLYVLHIRPKAESSCAQVFITFYMHAPGTSSMISLRPKKSDSAVNVRSSTSVMSFCGHEGKWTHGVRR